MTDIPTKLFGTDARHATFKRDLDKLLKKHTSRLPADHILAITAQVLGMVIAMQDQRKYTSEMVMAIVSENIQVGNDGMVKNLMASKGTA
jgi:hypothetical protein